MKKEFWNSEEEEEEEADVEDRICVQCDAGIGKGDEEQGSVENDRCRVAHVGSSRRRTRSREGQEGRKKRTSVGHPTSLRCGG